MEADLSNLIGRRIRLLHTDDPYTKLHYGSLGTIKDIWVTRWHEFQVWVEWDSDSGVSLVLPLDSFEFVRD